MLLYHASVYVSNFGRMDSGYARLSDRGREMYNSCEHILESYHYVHRENWVRKMRADNRRIFLDSGAFSAFMLGAKIDLGKYCDYILANQDIVLQASVLDVIGDCDGTWRNQIEMERRGTSPLPCYHYGEPTEVLDWYVSKYPYITIGGMVPISSPQLKIWLDRIWEEHLTNIDGSPRLKVHGFGLTSPALMARYPWWSVDSSTWQALGSNGSIVMPNGWGAIAISANASQRKIEGQHVDSLAGVHRQAIEDYVKEHGCDPALMREHHSHRWAWNMWAMPKLANATGHMKQFAPVDQRLF